MTLSILILILGLVVLIIGGEFLVKGSVGIANFFSISSLVIGMTVVSFGTSAPELIVSLKAALGGNPEIAIGNVIGSNIANLGLVLGITALIFPLLIDRQSIKVDWPMLMFASALFYLFTLDGIIERWEGSILFFALITFTIWLIRNSKQKLKEHQDIETEKGSIYKALSFTVLGLAGLYFGSEWLLIGAIDIAEQAGMSKHLIGVTIIAFGTSVPELTTSCIAAFRKQTDISIGNLIGSNIFNIMAVIGLTGIVHPINVEKNVLDFDVFWVLGIALALFPIMRFRLNVSRPKGAFLLIIYLSYVFILLS